MAFDTLKNYFLGLMPANEAESLELRIISGEIEESDLVEAENDLIESYLDGKLSNDEMEAFRRNFLISNERRSRFEIVKTLKNLPLKPDSQTDANPIFFERVIAFFKLRPISLAFGVVAVLIIAGIAWQVLIVNKPTAIETEIAALSKQDLSDLTAYKGIKSLTLTSDSFRSGGSVNVISEKEVTEKVLVRLILGGKSESNEEFTVKIIGNGKPIKLLPTRPIGQEVRILLPKSSLAKGEYQVLLERNGEKYNFNFTVQ